MRRRREAPTPVFSEAGKDLNYLSNCRQWLARGEQGQEWRCTSGAPVLRQEHLEFKASLGLAVRTCLKTAPKSANQEERVQDCCSLKHKTFFLKMLCLGSWSSLPSVTGFAVHSSRAWGAAALLLRLGLSAGNRVKKRKLYHRPPTAFHQTGPEQRVSLPRRRENMEDRETISGPVTGHTFLLLGFPLCKMGIGPFYSS